MSDLSGYSGKETIRKIQSMGFMWTRTKGSHAVLCNGSRVCIVPLHEELAVGTLRGILRQAGITPAEFLNAD